MAKRCLAVASGGGHWVQLMRLLPLFEHYDCYYASTHISENTGQKNISAICDVNARSRLKLIWAVLVAIFVLLKVRPKVVVTTGALPGLIMLVLAKYILRSKTVWLDSIANAEKLSMSGLAAGKFADIWLTQWPDLAEKYEGLDYLGSVL